jgi:hypothetical protein
MLWCDNFCLLNEFQPCFYSDLQTQKKQQTNIKKKQYPSQSFGKLGNKACYRGLFSKLISNAHRGKCIKPLLCFKNQNAV